MDKRNGNPSDVIYVPPVTPDISRVRGLETIGKVPSSPSLSINRMAYNVSQFNEDFVPIPTTTAQKLEKFKPNVSRNAWIRRLRSLFPISLWLPEYNIKDNLMADILVGITIAIFQVPQSMGYCLIANVPPVYGLYSSFFPALFYTILGTGMHCAFGLFAIVSGVMTGDIVIQVMHQLNKELDKTPITDGDWVNVDKNFEGLKDIDIAIMIAIIIGTYILVFGIFQLGFLSNFMSEELISGFTTSACVIVFVSQLRYLLGVDLGHFSGPFNLIYALKEVFERLDEINMTTLEISGICLSILIFFKLVVNRLTLKTGIKTPFPIELFVVIGGTLVSHLMDLQHNPYNVKIVSTIGDKFPIPRLPVFELFPIMWDKCIATAIVGYTITLSVGKIYGKKHGYKTDANQEMIAMGVTNIASAFFQCIPSASSLPRSALQETAGGKTQVVSIVNCCCIVVVILALGKYLEELPTCVLGSCIAVALVSLISKIGEFRRFWKVSKLDGMIWLITFWGVILISVDYGIYIGLICSLLLLIYKSQRPKTYLLGSVPDLDIYVPVNKFDRVEEINGFRIFQFCGPLNFSNVEYFVTELENKCEVNLTNMKKFINTKEYKQNVEKISNLSYEKLPELQLTRLAVNQSLPKYLIIDCSMFSFIDFTGITTLKKTIQSFEEIGVKTVLTGIHVHLESMLAKEGFFDVISTDHLYKSVADAIVCLKEIDDQFKNENRFEVNTSNAEQFWRDSGNNEDNEQYFRFKNITSQMNSSNNSFKNYSMISLNEEILQNQNHNNRNNNRYQTSPYLPRVASSPALVFQSRPAISPLAINRNDSTAYDSEGMETPPNSPSKSSSRNRSFLYDMPSPGSETTTVTVLSPQPRESDLRYPSYIPAPPPLPTNSKTTKSIPPPPPRTTNSSIPIPPPPPPPPNSTHSKSRPTHSSSNSKNKIPVPPLLPVMNSTNNTRNAYAYELGPKPEEPEIDFSSDDSDVKKDIKYRITPKIQRNVKQNTQKTKHKISEALKARSNMLEKCLDRNLISDA